MTNFQAPDFFSAPETAPMPTNLRLLLKTVSKNRFDPMLGYGNAMAIIAALAQQNCRIRITDGFESEISLFFLQIANSGSGKGSIFKNLYAPLGECIAQRRYLEREENKKRLGIRAALSSIIAEKKKQARRLSGFPLDNLAREIADLENKKPEMIPEYIFDVQDVTSASLLEELYQQKSHSILIADAEGRFMRSLDEDKALASMLNQTFVGEAISNSRVSVKSRRVDNPRVSLVVAIQPDKLKRLTRNPNLWGEGLLPRMLPYYSPIRGFQPQSPIGEFVNNESINWWQEKVNYLFKLPIQVENRERTFPYILELDNSAKIIFERHAATMQAQKERSINPGMVGTYSRMAELTARLGAVYHILEQPFPFDTPISASEMDLAVDASLFFMEHIHRLYGEFYPLVVPMMKVLPKLCDWLRSRDGTQVYVTIKDMYHGIGTDREGWREAINFLIQQGVLIYAFQYIPAHTPWKVLMSYGFTINFQMLANINW